MPFDVPSRGLEDALELSMCQVIHPVAMLLGVLDLVMYLLACWPRIANYYDYIVLLVSMKSLTHWIKFEVACVPTYCELGLRSVLCTIGVRCHHLH